MKNLESVNCRSQKDQTTRTNARPADGRSSPSEDVCPACREARPARRGRSSEDARHIASATLVHGTRPDARPERQRTLAQQPEDARLERQMTLAQLAEDARPERSPSESVNARPASFGRSSSEDKIWTLVQRVDVRCPARTFVQRALDVRPAKMKSGRSPSDQWTLAQRKIT
ncbi:hypothetical protein LR48_Vigan320s000300 [Vigna angularis]|uniref:Uncharacterized protein n=1 Tax=Phaseolus angularis TaxID=3914 RepID=A0A0L9T8X7_PHAAN|nr:hypothetical protein LR48_Vigan320s000300 [Vigna angularis]